MEKLSNLSNIGISYIRAFFYRDGTLDDMKIQIRTRKILRHIGFIVFLLLLAPLVFSVIHSGYLYTFDSDELAHVQIIYRMARGEVPFVTFFSIYSPLIHWLLAPVFGMFGFTIDAIYASRIVMIALFGLRVGAAAALTFVLFKSRLTLLFIPLLLLEPFTVFSGMQIRPDNLMLFLYTAGLLLLTAGFRFKKNGLVLFAGMFLSGALLASIKIAPSIGVLAVFLFFSFLREKQQARYYILALGCMLPVGVFLFYFFLQGTLGVMLTHLIIYSKANSDAVLNPALLGIFYWPDNGYIYGLMGRPPSWFFAWIIPIVAFPSAYRAITDYLSSEKKHIEEMILAFLGTSLLIHFISLLFVRSVFVQYYLPLTWLYVLFFVLTIRDFLSVFSKNKWSRWIVTGIIGIGFFALYATSIKANFERAKYFSAKGIITTMTKRWSQIPSNTPVFGDVMFRPSVYPVSYGFFIGDLPTAALTTFPSLKSSIERYKLPKLILKDYALQFLKPEDQSYIKEHYTRITDDDELWVRKE